MHEFVTEEMEDERGRLMTGAYCVRCSMFAPWGLHMRLEPCRPIKIDPETRPRPTVVT